MGQKFDNTKDSLGYKSHRTLLRHPNANKGYSRHPSSLYRMLRRIDYTSAAPSTKKEQENRTGVTPIIPGIIWQMDVEYVPTARCNNSIS